MQHVQHHVPVTALVFYGKHYILSGEGTHLFLRTIDGTVLSRTCVFNDQAIHGVALLDDTQVSTAIVWGGPLLRPLSLASHDGEVHIILGQSQSANDWILDAVFAPSKPLRAGLVTAHNALTTLDIQRTQPEQRPLPLATLEPRIAGSNCILYSAHLIWLSASHCLIASGTSFGDIIVWSAILGEDEKAPTERQVHFSFSAHEGSVFGVRLSSQLSAPDCNLRRVLTSCSDDRTVRLWDVSDLETSKVEPLQQHTGFGSRPKAGANAPQLLAKAMGHISRIWQARYADAEHTDELMRIQSFGEDGSVITWAFRTGPSTHSLIPVHNIKPHAGKNIWSIATSDESGVVATGGAEGAIAVHRPDSLTASCLSISSPKSSDSDNRHAYRSYGFVQPTVLIATTDRGTVMLIALTDSSRVSEVTEICPPLRGLASYSFVSAVPSLAFLGGTDGVIYLYAHAEQRVIELASVPGKIAGLFSQRHDRDVALLACTVNSTAASLFLLEQIDNWSSHPILATQETLELSKGFVTTSFAHHTGEECNYAILGSRSGSIAFHTYSGGSRKALHRHELLTDVHSKEAVTALHWITRKATSECSERHSLISTGRDGTVAMHTIRLFGDQIKLQLVHQLSLPFGPNIEGVLVSDDIGAFAWGFRNKHFVVFDLHAQRESMAVECGGVHRNWAFHITKNGGRFVWTKASEVFQAFQSSLPYNLIKRGGHGREIKAVSTSILDREQIIATGAEDTDIKLFKVGEENFRCVHTLRKHNTGIQHLEWDASYLFSSGGFEEFFIWHVRPKMPVIGVGVVCESVHPRSGSSDLRIMGFDVQQADAPPDFMVAMAYSDSTLKRWRYHQRTWELIASADYLTSCMRQVFRMTEEKHVLWTTAGDGHLSRWDMNEQSPTWTNRYKVHQSSIHDAVYVSLGGGVSLVITGGDDNAIGMTRITESGRKGTSLIPRAHAAAVTGLAILPLRQGACCLVSASIDQRIKVWQICCDHTQLNTSGLRVKQLHDVHTPVADVSSVGLCTLRDGGVGVVVCGVGMDLWRIPLAEAQT